MISDVKRQLTTIPIFSTLENTAHATQNGNGIAFWWSRKDVGFGFITLSFDKDGQLLVDNEGMSPEFCGEIITQAITEALARQRGEEGQS